MVPVHGAPGWLVGKAVCNNRELASQSCQLLLPFPHPVLMQSHIHPPGPAFTHLIPGWNLSAVFSVGRAGPALPHLTVTPFLGGWDGWWGAQAPPTGNICQRGDTFSKPEVPLPRGPLEMTMRLDYPPWPTDAFVPPELSIGAYVGKSLPCTYVTPNCTPETPTSLSPKNPLEVPGHPNPI